jgi:Glycosyl transferase family 2
MTGRTTASKPKDASKMRVTSSGNAGGVTIALVVNTKNEEAKLAAAIASCLGVDDIVVADMASTDETVTIARAAGARILELPDVGYCEPGRQAAIDAADADWVLLLDADERLSPGGLDRLRQVVATAPAHVSSYLLPRPTRLKGQTILGTGWSINLERQARLFRRDQVTWPTKIHGFPTFTGAVVELPEGTDVVIFHECFDDLTHAYRKFNTYSAVEAAERVAAGHRSTWVDALRDGIAEIERRYEPEIDGGLSLGLAMGMFFYRFETHVKAMELSDILRDAPMPPASVMRSAWGSLWSTLREHEIAATRERIGSHLADGQLALGVAALNEALLTWGLVPDLLVESAVVAHTAGDDHNARSFCQQALAIDPGHAEARTTALALDVAMGRRPPVRNVFIDRPPGPLSDETVVVALDDSGGQIEAPLDGLPFAPASLLRIQISLETLSAYDDERQDAVVAHLLTLLAPEGRLELVRKGPESLLARWPGSLLVVDSEPRSS